MTGAILVVDDDPGILDVVDYALKREGFEVELVGDGATALERAREGSYDLVVLDLMLPGLPGLEVCRALRAEKNHVPILMLTAKDAELDRVLGLELGADDYVAKPFSAAELVSRVRAILRRRDFERAERSGAIAQVGQLRLDPARHQVHVGDEPVQLTRSEFRLLALLAEEPERTYSRRQILEHLWESDHVGDEHACDVHVSNLRRKIERDPARPERLVTVRGYGYKLVPS